MSNQRIRMGRNATRALFGVAMIAVLTAPLTTAQAQDVPEYMTYTGFLKDTGTPVNGTTDLIFTIYDQDSGGTLVWTETRSTVPVVDGVFNVVLGDMTTLPATVFNGSSFWLEVSVDGQVMSPRQELTTVPYAFRAQQSVDASYLGGYEANDFALKTDLSSAGSATVNWDNLSGVPADLTDGDADTTYTAGAGLTLAGTVFSVDPSTVQSRVIGTCAAGSSIRSIAANGSVTCETDTDTTYTAGTGLILAGTVFSADTNVVQARVTGTCAAGSSIRSIAANGTVTCEADTVGYTNSTCIWRSGTACSLAGASGSSCMAHASCGAGERAIAGGCSGYTSVAIGRSDRGGSGGNTWYCYWRRIATISNTNPMTPTVLCCH